jgi:hypothetical protein
MGIILNSRHSNPHQPHNTAADCCVLLTPFKQGTSHRRKVLRIFFIGGSSTSKPPGTSLQLIDESSRKENASINYNEGYFYSQQMKPVFKVGVKTCH